MTLLGHLPARLQWLRGPTGSIVAHWLAAAVGSGLGHLLVYTSHGWSWGAEVAAVVIVLAFAIREWFDWWLTGRRTDEAVQDLLGPVANMLYVLVL